MHVPSRFWSDVILTACYLINRISYSVLGGVSPLPPALFYSQILHDFILLPVFLDVSILFIFMILIMENWMLVQPSVSFLAIHALKKAIDVTVLIFSGTLWVLLSLSSSLNHSFLNTFFLSPLHPTSLFLNLFLLLIQMCLLFSLSQSMLNHLSRLWSHLSRP